MLFRKFVLLAIVTVLFSNVSIAADQSKELYWICYSDFYKTHAKFLMQIDSSGNIVKPPKMLALPFQFDSAASAIAMSHSRDRNIVAWIAGKGGSLFRLLISKQDMTIIEINKIELHTGLIESFAGAQKAEHNFLALKTTGNGLRAFPINSSGFPFTRRNWPISPDRIGDNSGGFARQQVGVTADGGMSFWTDTRSYDQKLYVQPLDQNGRIHGASKFIVSVFDPTVGYFGGIDITNQLPGNKRFLVYAFGPEERGGSIVDHLYLQIINSDSGEKIGPRITLYQPHEGDFNSYSQNVAVDPSGKFLVFEDSNLFFVQLDSSGRKKGSLKKLVPDKTISGIDLLLEQN